jgi:DNA-binding NarL/FixJ family response regulator
MDVRMPGVDGITATRQLSATGTRIIVLTSFDLDEYLFAALRAGASGFLIKNSAPTDLRRAVHLVAGGQALLDPAVTRRVIDRFTRHEPRTGRLAVLTGREREIVDQIAAGRTNEEIAAALQLSIWTVKTHVGAILKTVQRRLGHATVAETLDTYAHLWPDSDERTREAIDSVLRGQRHERPSAQAAPPSGPSPAQHGPTR